MTYVYQKDRGSLPREFEGPQNVVLAREQAERLFGKGGRLFREEAALELQELGPQPESAVSQLEQGMRQLYRRSRPSPGEPGWLE